MSWDFGTDGTQSWFQNKWSDMTRFLPCSSPPWGRLLLPCENRLRAISTSQPDPLPFAALTRTTVYKHTVGSGTLGIHFSLKYVYT